MKKHLIKMPSISQFRGAIRDIKHQAQYVGQDEDDKAVYDETKELPTVTFTGTTKLHGTNASVCYNGEELWAQSKENIITPEKDNAGFAMFVHKNEKAFGYYLSEIRNMLGADEVVIYGEWAGKGIQKGVAVSELPKTFYMFGIKYKILSEDEYHWIQNPSDYLVPDSENNIRSIFEFDTYTINIDFENPSEAQNKMIEWVEDIDKECPVGKALGEVGHGEGIVWTGWYKDTKHTFKTKGESHSKSRVKTLKPVYEAKEMAKITFANYACSGWRLEQAYQETFDTLNGGKGDIALTGNFMRWVISDIMKEELDVMADYDLEPKEVNKTISTVARRWLMDKLDEEAGL